MPVSRRRPVAIMTTQEIWALPVPDRMDAFIERWQELEETTGNRTLKERDEMAAIADAILSHLIEENQTLRQRIEDRKVIEQAKGLLAQTRRWNESKAYKRLQRGSMDRRVPMVELARKILGGERVDL